jgi:hypothetical protein
MEFDIFYIIKIRIIGEAIMEPLVVYSGIDIIRPCWVIIMEVILVRHPAKPR